MKIDLDIKVEYFDENQKSVENIMKADPVLKKTFEDILEFMAYAGIERVTISGKTKEDDKKYRENLKTRKVEL